MILRLKGVKKVVSKGHVYHYHRKTMTSLPGAPGSAEFVAKLVELQAKGGNAPVQAGTLGALIILYRGSAEYRQLAPTSKRQYGKALARLQLFAAAPLISVTPRRLYELRDRLAEKYSRSAANGVLKMLRLLFAFAVKREIHAENPAAVIDLIRRPKDAPVVNRPWKDTELEIVLATAPGWLKIPIAIAAYTGLRESDVVRVTWGAYDGSSFETRQQKTGHPVWVPAHYRLREILDGTTRQSPQIVVGVRGRPMSANVLGSRFFLFINKLQAEGRIGPGLSFHGLRHTLGTRLAEAGANPASIAETLGQLTIAMGQHYSRTADRREHVAAAMALLEERDRNGKRKTVSMKMENP